MPSASPSPNVKSNSTNRAVAADGFPYATIALLLACGAATLAFQASGRSELFICFPREPLQVYGVPALLSLFTHEGFEHLAVNATFLLIAGVSLERRSGPGRVLALFLLCGLAGIGGQAMLTPTGTIGASGAACGLVVAAFTTGAVDVKTGAGLLAAALIAWLLLDFLAAHQPDATGGGFVGHGAHLGGAAAGFLLSLSPALSERPASTPASSG